MFYNSKIDPTLRFGDVLQGYVLASTSIKSPNPKDYSVDIKTPDYCVVLTPCCSIEQGTILLSPLIPVLSDFFKNEYFEEDLTRINRQMKLQNKFSKHEWKDFSLEKKAEIESKGKEQWSNVNYFVYDGHPIFPEYKLRKHQIRYYMIDFRRAYRLKCPMIKRKEKMKEKDTPIIESKILQLTNKTREELRTKLSFFYFRKPEEGE